MRLTFPAIFDGGTVQDAFHGTDEPFMKEIRLTGFKCTVGDAVWFFLGDYDAAFWWTEYKAFESPVVVQAKVTLGRVLHVNLLKDQMSELQQRWSARRQKNVDYVYVYEFIASLVKKHGIADALRIVRHREGIRSRPNQLKSEVMLVVFDPKKVEILKEFRDGEIVSSGTLELAV